ncbi:VOC family protein [Actinomycetaceae bacterium L2_0104]
MQKIVPNIWFNRNAVEAAEFYARVFPSASYEIQSYYPREGLPDFQKDFAGLPLTVRLQIEDLEFTLINAGDEFRPNISISFMVNFDPLRFAAASGATPDSQEAAEAAHAALDSVWSALIENGKALMDLGAYDFSPHYGWVEDRYGVSWQLILTDPAGEPRPFITPSFMFGADAQNKCRETVERYLAVFPDAAWGNVFTYPAPTGPASRDSIMYSDFSLAGQWFVAMDSGAEQVDTFTCGVSFEVKCADQAEIDHFWNALSAVPEAEICGWLADSAGVSWQIVPENMDELMDRPNAYQKLMKMSKIQIAEF